MLDDWCIYAYKNNIQLVDSKTSEKTSLNPIKNLKGPWESKPHHRFPAMSYEAVLFFFFFHSVHCVTFLCVSFVASWE